MAYFPQYFQDKAVQGRLRNCVYLLCQWRMGYIQLHGYILCPSSEAEVMRHHHLFSGYKLLQRLSSGKWAGSGRWVRGRGHGPWAFSVEYLLGQCYSRDKGVSGWTSLCLAIVKPQSQREKETRKHWWLEKRAWGPKSRRKHPPTIGSTRRGLSDHHVSFHLESNRTNLRSQFLPKAQISVHFLSLIRRFNP